MMPVTIDSAQLAGRIMKVNHAGEHGAISIYMGHFHGWSGRGCLQGVVTAGMSVCRLIPQLRRENLRFQTSSVPTGPPSPSIRLMARTSLALNLSLTPDPAR